MSRSTSGRAAALVAIVVAVASAVATPFAALAADSSATPPADGLSFGGEARLRYTSQRNLRLEPGKDLSQAQFRGLVHADYRVTPRFRMYGELGTGQVGIDRAATNAALQNRASLQQLYIDVGTRRGSGAMQLGATLGRQEFAEGPRQLVSAGDGANLRRTWNGARAYVEAAGYKATAFEFRATRLAPGAFDERIRSDAVLRGVIAEVALAQRSDDARGGAARSATAVNDRGDASLQAFWLHTTMPATPANGSGIDERDTFGARLTGSRGPMRWDWTIAQQQGRAGTRNAHAWAVFAVQSLALSRSGWKPRLTSHVDVASRDFNPLYASSSYLGEGQFLGLTNLLLVAPGIAVSPTAHTTLSLEIGHARRLDAAEPAFAGGMRAYSGTAGARGRYIGNLARLSAGWTASSRLSFNFSAEHLAAGAVLHQAGLAGSTYVQLGATFRY
jgi:hypothetical protein